MAIDIEKVAHLARLTLSEEAKESYPSQLENILALAEQMNDVPTDDVTPMAHPMDTHQPLREDTVTETNQRDLFQSIAPLVESGLYLVPQVIAQKKEEKSHA